MYVIEPCKLWGVALRHIPYKEVSEGFEAILIRLFVHGNRIRGGTVAQWLALLPHSKKVLGSFPAQPGPFCVEFACSPRVCVGFLRVLRFPPTSKDMHRQC